MAITAALLTSGTDTTASHTSITTASVTPTANRLVLLAVFSRATMGTAPTVSGCGLTWVLVAGSHTIDATWPTFLFRAMGAAPTAGAITVTFGGGASSNNTIWGVSEFAGVDTTGANGSGAIVQSKNGYAASSTDPFTLTYTSAFGSGTNGGFACIGTGSGAYMSTPRASPAWSELADTTIGGTAALASHFIATSDTAASATHGSSGLTVGGVAVEIKEAGGGGGSTQPARTQHQFRQRMAA